MLTQSENAALRQKYAAFIAQCTAYTAFLTANKLPFSSDLAELTAAYRRQLFERLLVIDAGLSARYELLRTEEGKEKLISDTVNTDGHELVDQVSQILQALTAAYRHISFSMGHQLEKEIPIARFARAYALDLGRVLDAKTMDWSGSEHVRVYFAQMAPELTRIRDIFRHVTRNDAGLAETFIALAAIYHEDSTAAPVTVNEHFLYARLIPELEQKNLLNMVPRATK